MTEIVTFGETMLRLSPPAGERIESTDALELRSAGAESNVAIATQRLGADAVWLSKLPDSALGRRVAADVRQHDVDVRVAWDEGHRQGTYYIEQAGEPRGTNVIYDRENAAVTTADVAELDVDAVESADVFFTTGITPALSDTLATTTERLLDASSTAAFDLNYRSKLWSHGRARERYESLLPAVDLLFAPERDARNVLGLSGDAEDIAESLLREYDCDIVVLTRGENGAVAVTGQSTVEQPALEAETVDPIGTGDAFVGAFLSRYVREESLQTALRYAAATAALKRTIRGDIAFVSESEVEGVLDAESADISR